jgi:hypothetical protein
MMQAGVRDRGLRRRAGGREHGCPGGLSGCPGRREQRGLAEAGLAANKQHGFGQTGLCCTSRRCTSRWRTSHWCVGRFGWPAGHLTDQRIEGVKLTAAPVQT